MNQSIIRTDCAKKWISPLVFIHFAKGKGKMNLLSSRDGRLVFTCAVTHTFHFEICNIPQSNIRLEYLNGMRHNQKPWQNGSFVWNEQKTNAVSYLSPFLLLLYYNTLVTRMLIANSVLQTSALRIMNIKHVCWYCFISFAFQIWDSKVSC